MDKAEGRYFEESASLVSQREEWANRASEARTPDEAREAKAQAKKFDEMLVALRSKQDQRLREASSQEGIEEVVAAAHAEVESYKKLLIALEKHANETESLRERKALLKGIKAVQQAQQWVRELMLTLAEEAAHKR